MPATASAGSSSRGRPQSNSTNPSTLALRSVGMPHTAVLVLLLLFKHISYNQLLSCILNYYFLKYIFI